MTCTVTCTNVGAASANNAFCQVTNAASLPGSADGGVFAERGGAAAAELHGELAATGSLIAVQGGTGATTTSTAARIRRRATTPRYLQSR